MREFLSRRRFREALAAPAAISPASVYDPLSARVAESVGYQVGMLAGSVAALTTLAAPDVMVATLTEVADQVRRIARVCDLGLLIDADHGYGNALSVLRTIEELEHAGAAAASIEDTLLPRGFGKQRGPEEQVSLEEMVGKLRAAVAGRRDPDFVIAGRTSSLRSEGIEGATRRVKAYAATGVDAIFVVGVESIEQVAALQEAAGLPLIIGRSPKAPPFDRRVLAQHGVALLLQGHQPVAAAAKALREVYAHLYAGGSPKELSDRLATEAEMDALARGTDFARWRDSFL